MFPFSLNINDYPIDPSRDNIWPWYEEEPYDRREEESDTFWCDFCNADVEVFIGQNDPLPTHCPVCGCEFQQDRP